MSRNVVDLPQPEGPSNAANCPGRTAKLTPSTAGSGPHVLLTERNSTSAKTVPNTSLCRKVFATDQAVQGQSRIGGHHRGVDHLASHATGASRMMMNWKDDPAFWTNAPSPSWERSVFRHHVEILPRGGHLRGLRPTLRSELLQNKLVVAQSPLGVEGLQRPVDAAR